MIAVEAKSLVPRLLKRMLTTQHTNRGGLPLIKKCLYFHINPHSIFNLKNSRNIQLESKK